MKKLAIALTVLCFSYIKAQTLPVQVPIPAPYTDPNISFNLLYMDAVSKDRFSALYYHTVYGSVMNGAEFVRDTGGTVYSDQKFKEMVPYSNGALFIRKQVFDLNGNVLETIDWLLAERRLESENTFRLYFPKGQKHPLVENRVKMTQSIYNVGGLNGLSGEETTALTNFIQQFIPKKDELGAPVKSEPRPGTIAGDIKEMKRQFKSLREAGMVMNNDLPSNEKLLTRFPITSDRIVCVTRTKGDLCEVKFYITEDYKSYHFVDSDTLLGDFTVNATGVVYDAMSQPSGAMVNLHVEFKNDKGEKVAKMHTFYLNSEYKLNRWEHVVGKNKMNSMSPELTWIDNGKLMVMTSNREKIFKPYVQIHRFDYGKPAEQLFPANDEEKGSEKTRYVKNLQPDQPVQTQTMAPIPDGNKPLYFLNVGGVQYIITQGTKYNEALKMDEYLTVHIYRIDVNGKLTEESLLSDIRDTKPFGFELLSKKADVIHYLLPYNNYKVQLIITAAGIELQLLSDDKSSLRMQANQRYSTTTANGTLLFKQGNNGKNTLLFYPSN